jgi:hypothetical protein
MASLREAYTNPDVAQGDFYSAQQIRYREVEPNRFLPENIKGSLGPGITNDTLSQFNRYDPYTESVSNKFSATGLSQLIQGQAKTTDEEVYCRGFTGAASLPKLIADQEAEGPSAIRCGWRYKKSPGGGAPLVSQGALGTRNGPLNAQEDSLGNGVEWIWDLKTALNRHVRDFTATLPASAAGLTTAQATFSNTAWCSQTNRYILVDEAGNPAPGYTCGAGSIVRNPANFPQTTPTAAASMASANATTLERCMRPGNNPSLSRDCLLQAVKTNGCSADGTLYQAIESARPTATTFSQFLQTQPSFMTYQSRQGDNKITEEMFKKDSGSWDLATREIQKLQNFTQTAQDPLVKVAAEDLCLSAGKFDQYDFCSELTDSQSIGGVDLKCMQAYWQEKNGKPAGLLYPSTKTLKPELGAITTWGQFRAAVDDLKSKVNSTNPVEQRKAINNFLGVTITGEPFTPLNIDGIPRMFSLGWQPLVFWLDANDGGSLTIDQNNRVRSWGDKSGRNNTVTQTSIVNRPIYRKEAFAGIEFNGADSFLPIDNAFSLVQGNSFTVIVVERRKSSKNNNFFLGGTTGARNANLVLGNVTSNILRFAFFANDVDGRTPNYQQSLEQTRIVAFEKTPTGRALYLNGQQLNRDSNMEVLSSWNGAAIGRFGMGDFYQGVLYEILIFNPGLTTERRQKVEGYLAHKWGIPMNLVTGHPFKNAAP